MTSTFKLGDRVRHVYSGGWLGTVCDVRILRGNRVRVQVRWDDSRNGIVRTHSADLLRQAS